MQKQFILTFMHGIEYEYGPQPSFITGPKMGAAILIMNYEIEKHCQSLAVPKNY
jgi:hypothetical protein